MRVPIKEALLYLLSLTKFIIIPVFIVSSFQNKKERSWSTGEVSLKSSKPRFMRETKTNSPVFYELAVGLKLTKKFTG